MDLTERELLVADLGTVPYDDALALQEQLRGARQLDRIGDTLLLLEHPAVFTRGRRSEPADLPHPPSWYAERGIAVRDTKRGGKVTYHAPGQLVGYPIVRVTDVLAFVRLIERAIVAALAEQGIAAQTREGLTGIWVEDRKIGSIGLHVSRGICTHGFSLNVDMDLAPWQWITPCGIESAQITSVAAELGTTPDARCIRREVAHQFAQQFGRKQRLISRDRLLTAAEIEPNNARPLALSQ